jgi:hypothetical protein
LFYGALCRAVQRSNMSDLLFSGSALLFVLILDFLYGIGENAHQPGVP